MFFVLKFSETEKLLESPNNGFGFPLRTLPAPSSRHPTAGRQHPRLSGAGGGRAGHARGRATGAHRAAPPGTPRGPVSVSLGGCALNNFWLHFLGQRWFQSREALWSCRSISWSAFTQGTVEGPTTWYRCGQQGVVPQGMNRAGVEEIMAYTLELFTVGSPLGRHDCEAIGDGCK